MDSFEAKNVWTAVACRLGMLYVHISLIPSTNVNLIVIQHFLNAALVTTLYLCYGYSLSVSKTPFYIEGWVFNSCTNLEIFFDKWRTMIFCEGLISIILAGRAHIVTDLFVLGVISVVQPIINNFLTCGTDLNTIGQNFLVMEDKNYLTVVHILPGGFAFIALLLYGKRALKINKIDSNSLSINAHSFNLLGYVMMAMGYIVQSSPFQVITSISAGMLITMALLIITRQRMDYWACVKVLQSVIATIIGTYSCTALFQVLYVTFAVIIIFMISSKFMKMLKVEDNCNLITIHGIIGWLSLTLDPLLNERKEVHNIIGSITLSTAVFIIGMLVGLICLVPLKYTRLLRSSEEMVLHKNSKELATQNKKVKGTFQPGSHTRIQMFGSMSNFTPEE